MQQWLLSQIGGVMKINRILLLLACLAFSSPFAYSQAISLDVDATQAPQKLLHSKLVIPARPGKLTLYYPKWLPGNHGPYGDVVDIAGLVITSGGKRLAWLRDPLDMYAIECEVPTGSSNVEVTFDYLIPSPANAFSGGNSTAKLAIIGWEQVLFYPRVERPEELVYAATVHLPQGWQFGTALAVAEQSAGTVKFKPVSLYTLIDSPLNSGLYFRKIPLAPTIAPAHEMDIAADSEEALQVPEALITEHTRMVEEADALFGSHPYGQYHFLLTLSDQLGHWGWEHHESCDIKMEEDFFSSDDSDRQGTMNTIPHEFVHSWNGKYRRPARMIATDYQQPIETNLVWIYEGLTEYLADVLAVRAGLLTPDQGRETFAWFAAALDRPRVGRNWRTLADTATAAQLAYYPGYSQWVGWRRKLDFYWEGPLIWLDADVRIRQLTHGTKSLDDFVSAFFGKASSPVVQPYNLDDIVAALNQVAPSDWKAFISSRVDEITPHPPVGGIEGGGWRMEYNDHINRWAKSYAQLNGRIFFLLTLGFSLTTDGTVTDTVPGMPAVQAGVGPGMKLLAVNGRLWTPANLQAAVKVSSAKTEPIELLFQNGDYVSTYRIDYHGGERQPHLVRDEKKPDLLKDIFTPRAAAQP
jgi:predicted metalloprotease with PDZ domain